MPSSVPEGHSGPPALHNAAFHIAIADSLSIEPNQIVRKKFSGLGVGLAWALLK